jgi:hypothetical protein
MVRPGRPRNRSAAVTAALLLGVVLAGAPRVAAAARPRSVTVTKTYTAANTFLTDDTAPRVAVRFPVPPWARSADMQVKDLAGAVEYWAGWDGTSAATFNCSQANESFTEPPTHAVVARRGRGDLLVAPAVSPVGELVTHAPATYNTCPYPYAAVPTYGTITVTFSSRATQAGRHR